VKNDIDDILLNRFRIFHGEVNARFEVRFEGPGFFEFIGSDAVSGWSDLTELFPETVGSEEAILRIMEGQRGEYGIISVNRTVVEEIFYNLYFIDNCRHDGTCIIVVRDLTNELLYRQALQQQKNEIQLLQQQLVDKNDDLDSANRALRASRDELWKLNQDLEIKVQERTGQLEESTKLSKRLFTQTVGALMNALEQRDAYTMGHQLRVSTLAGAIAREMELDDFTVEGIMVAGNLHDLGKISVPSEFLTKPGILTDEEFAVIKAHPGIGFRILKDIEFPWPVAQYVLMHHERLDGSGYPSRLRGEDIPLGAKILCVADVVEAMATPRPYRHAPGLDLALDEIMKFRGVRYDEQAVEACERLFRSGRFSWKIPVYKSGS